MTTKTVGIDRNEEIAPLSTYTEFVNVQFGTRRAGLKLVS